MACTVEHQRLYCTTSEVSFGPRFESEDEADRFLSWEFKNHGDPRQYHPDELVEHVQEFRGALCLNQSCEHPYCPEHHNA